MNAKTFTMISLLALSLMSTACAPKEFSAASEGELGLKNLGSETTGQGENEGELPATGETETETETGTPNPNPNPGTVIYPKITMKIPTCTSNQSCQVRVIMSRTDAKAVGYRWKTNDTKYQQDPGRYAQPGVHYVATGGVVTFNPGSTVQYKAIQTLSGFTQIDIPFLYGECTYDGRPVDCLVYNITLERM